MIAHAVMQLCPQKSGHLYSPLLRLFTSQLFHDFFTTQNAIFRSPSFASNTLIHANLLKGVAASHFMLRVVWVGQ